MRSTVLRAAARARALPGRVLGPQLRLARTALRLAPLATTAVMVVVVVSGVLPQAFNLSVGALVGAVLRALRTHQPLARAVLPALVAMVSLYWLQQAASALRQAVARYLERTIDNRLRVEVATGMSREPSLAFSELEAATRAVAAIRFGAWTPGYAVRFLCNLVATRVTALVALGIIAVALSPVAAIAIAAVWLAVRGRMRRAYSTSIRTVTREAATLARSRYLLGSATRPGPERREIVLLDLAGWLAGEMHRAWLASMREVWAARGRGQRDLLPALAAVVLLYLAVLAAVVVAAAHGQVGPALVPVLAIALQASAGIADYGTDDTLLELSAPALGQVRAGLELMSRASGGCPAPAGAARPPARGPEIRFEGVRFTYPNGHRVFEDLSLAIGAGEAVALVGLNGAGKSTLIKLLCRFFEPEAGAILVDGEDYRRLDRVEWQRSIAPVFQEPVRYPVSLDENVRFGRVERRGGESELARALDEAGVSELVARLPEGGRTLVTPDFADGSDLSGGQWQRVALARALRAKHTGACLMILDEPTSHLDVRAEHEFNERFLRLTAGATAVLVSQRLSTVRSAERILYLRDGQVAEAGTHDQLIGRAGHYARLFEAQARAFQGSAAGAAGSP